MSGMIDLLEQNRQWEFLKHCIKECQPVYLESISLEDGPLQITINGYTYEEKNEI